MVKKNNNTRQHSTPGLYFSDTVVEYASKSLGITALGLVGETLKGRAFEPTPITDWGDFINNFGGTSTEQYQGSKYPKYELPYIAQSYLNQSHNLNVVRVLGLSGVNAGPAWAITAHGTQNSDYNNMVVLILRSRGEHKKASFVRSADPSQGICDDVYEYDGIHYFAKDIELIPSKTLNLGQNCNPGYTAPETGYGDSYFTSDALNYGTFTIKVLINDNKSELAEEERNYKYYSVTLNPTDKNYIYNVIGGDPEKGDAEIYVEELYDVALKQLIKYGEINGINQSVAKYENINIVPKFQDVYDLLTNPLPTKKDLGRRYLYSNEHSVKEDGESITVFLSTDDGNTWEENPGVAGQIYTVYSKINHESGKRTYFYGAYVLDTNARYDEVTDTAEIEQLENSLTCVTKSESSSSNPQNSFGTAPTDTLEVTNSPMYVMTGKGNPKVLSAGDAGMLYADGQNPLGTQTLSDYHQVTEAHADDVIVFEVGSRDDKLHTITFKVKYGNDYLKPISGEASQEDEYAFEVTDNENGFWRLFVHLGGPDVDFDYSTTERQYGPASDPSKISVEFVSTKYYKKVLNTQTEGKYINGVEIESEHMRKTEMLTIFNYTTDVDETNRFTNCVYVISDKSFYVRDGKDVKPITLDFNNYKEQYRWASSPWIVSEMKGSAENVELNKLFRFHAISDGSNSNTEFKISIENIDPSTGKFDVVVRDYYDSDYNVNILEKFSSCNMVPGSSNYIGLKIGSTDGLYNSKSNYITVEVIENDITKNSIPAGFLGYPVRDYTGFAITKNNIPVIAPYFEYNTMVDDEIKNRKQYFGISDLVGYDEDIFSYKGVEAYDGNPEGLTPCFHLDARILNGKRTSDGDITEGDITQKVSVDGITGYSFVTVSRNNTTSEGIEPRIGDEATMYGTIYEDKSLRKFTVAMYGGWDGWDYYRTSRSNGDEYKYNVYKGAIDTNSGYGTMFNVVKNPESLGFDSTDKVITSDYYAYLGGVKQFGNPHSITVNVLATPGIDYVNNTSLVDEVIDIVEEDRGDLIYVVTTPDKPFGAGDSQDEMYTVEDAVNNLDDTDIDSNHCCTYYPWVKYYDSDNFQYVYLPLTRDVVTSIAYTDNVKFSWYSNAGWNRGNIPDSASPKKKITSPEQSVLYNGRINFVNSFAEEGNKIWGDKNLQIDDNLLNRISKRRLLLRIRTMLKNACIGLLFDPNDVSQSKTVRSAVTKVLDTVKQGRGIFDYKIEIDDSPETRDQLGLNVVYHIKPVQNLEWINFTSVLTPEGMQWD